VVAPGLYLTSASDPTGLAQVHGEEIMDKPNQPVDPGTKVDSTTRRGEEIAANEKEAGRADTGTQGATERPTGTSTARDYTSVDPKGPKDGGSPAG
jgi:hypothetical protein